MTTDGEKQAITEEVDPAVVRSRKREEGKERLLKNLLSNRYDTMYTRVASVLNKHKEARNNDQELQLRYWEAYEGYRMGNPITPDELKKYTRLTSLTRARAKIQNEFGLFRAEATVEGYRKDLAGEHRQRATAVKPQSNPLIFVYADESGKAGGEAYLIVGSVWFNDMQRHEEVQHDMRAWLAECRERAQQEQIRFPDEFHFTEMKRNQLELYKQFFDKVMQFSDMVSFKAVAVRKSQLQYKTLEQSVYSLYYQLAHLGIEHEVHSGRLSLPRGICYYKDADDGSDKLHLEETRQLLRERFKSNYEEELRLEALNGMPSKTFVAVQISDLVTGAVSRKLNMPEGNNHKDQFAEYVLERLNVDYIRHEVSEIDNGRTAANIEFKKEQDMFYVHIFE
ncbi:DUF3800 domain-containing protein [Bacillus inaquosorum]|uniref:DUF3800 domain-containing protein n=1 Tax=Bacillus inaquosorum KCTC 13429 TaxID=1236548 RepID=A0A9W5PBT8_9BACI|nr:DUF3800 domain-containing protein [Bacillus inaquosorum]AWM18369.1 DUF3800 domain-containing protein [Bacillus inaquosorum]ELS59959.1 hypothetical protein BSI_34750 [Bacillus inaquosorum KCTC 13429]MCY7904141.1 DUF3800 domain-containing protein [Bacillus inaquosorum]MCY7931452.1 DUF3800 domain-containing protein [Bacillus inaquosorum]MCY8770142.1 DUF3800 domain-containing protein [Bacillus inaquosorum]